MWLHHRTDDHEGLEDCTTVVLTEQIGRYEAGMLLCEVLSDLYLRLQQVQIDTTHGFSLMALDAWITPYAGAGAMGYIGLDAVIRAAGAASFALDAELVAPTTEEQAASFGLDAFFIARAADGITVLTQPVDLDDTVIHVDDPSDFPSTCPFDILIGDEVMTVVAGCGTNTWTVVRTNPQTHPVGAYVVTC